MNSKNLSENQNYKLNIINSLDTKRRKIAFVDNNSITL